MSRSSFIMFLIVIFFTKAIISKLTSDLRNQDFLLRVLFC